WKEAPRPAWSLPVGEGYSSPVVARGRVFVHARVKDKDEEEVLALDAKTGKVLWRDAYPRAPFASAVGAGPRATPSVVLGRVFTLGVTGVLSCYQADTGKVLWRVDLYKRVGGKPPRFGVCSSPVVEGGLVVVSVGGEGSSVVAFDAEKGAVAWQALDDPASTSSPAAVVRTPRPGDVRHEIVVVTGQNVLGVRTLDG